jgi:hypothetical protein
MIANSDNVRGALRRAGLRWNGCVWPAQGGGVIVRRGYGGTLEDAAAALEGFELERHDRVLIVRGEAETSLEDPGACPRCGGAGGRAEWPGYTCYRCGGSGRRPNG